MVGSYIARSGLGIPTESLRTSIWNALVVGHKRWCLFPPQTSVSLRDENDKEKRKQQEKEAITWFNTFYPKTKYSNWPEDCKPIEILQNPGETIFVPLGYWHVVLNLDDKIAVTQIFCNEINFESVWNSTALFQSDISLQWSKALRVSETSINLPRTIY